MHTMQQECVESDGAHLQGVYTSVLNLRLSYETTCLLEPPWKCNYTVLTPMADLGFCRESLHNLRNRLISLLTFMLVLVHSVFITMWLYPSVLYAVPANRKQIKCSDFVWSWGPARCCGQFFLGVESFHFLCVPSHLFR